MYRYVCVNLMPIAEHCMIKVFITGRLSSVCICNCVYILLCIHWQLSVLAFTAYWTPKIEAHGQINPLSTPLMDTADALMHHKWHAPNIPYTSLIHVWSTTWLSVKILSFRAMATIGGSVPLDSKVKSIALDSVQFLLYDITIPFPYCWYVLFPYFIPPYLSFCLHPSVAVDWTTFSASEVSLELLAYSMTRVSWGST